MFYTGSEWFRAKCFEEPTPPAWGEDEVSAISDATGGRVDGSAGPTNQYSGVTYQGVMPPLFLAYLEAVELVIYFPSVCAC